MNSTHVTVKITNVSDIQHFGEKGFRKIDVEGIEQPEGKWPNHLMFTGKNTKADELANLQVDDTVAFEYVVEGRLWEKEDKRAVFMNLVVLNHRMMGIARTADQPQQQSSPAGQASNKDQEFEKIQQWSNDINGDDDLPF